MIVRPNGYATFREVRVISDRVGITADCWDDMRVGVSELRTGTGQPPIWKKLADDGGAVGTALDFESSNAHRVAIGDNAAFDIMPVTIEAWVRIESLTNGYIFDKQGQYTLAITTNGRIQFIVTGPGATTYQTGNGVVAVGSWIHIVAVHDGEAARIYKNGVLVLQTFDTKAAAPTANAAYIGGRAGASNFDGLIDEVVLYNTALTAEEVARTYNDGEGVNHAADAAIVGLWKLDDGAGGAAVDSSGNGLDGSLEGAAGVPAWVSGKVTTASKGIQVPHFEAGTAQEVWLETQFSHRLKQGSNVYFHIHIVPRGSAGMTGDVTFKVEWLWLNAKGDPVGNTQLLTGTVTIAAGEGEETNMVTFAALVGTGKHVSSCFHARVYRDSGDTWAGDVAIQSADLHYLVDGNGSDNESSKTY